MTDNRSLPVRFWALVRVGDPADCWEWQGTTLPPPSLPYGQFRAGRMVLAHRFAYATAHGVIPEGHVICHSCDNPGCVNPFHLFAGTQRDNVRDSMSKGRDARGERSGGAKLTEAQVREIRELWQGGTTQVAIAERYGVHSSQISRIVRGLYWTEI